MDLLNPGIVHFYLIPELSNHDLFTFFTLTKDNYLGYSQESKRILKNRYLKSDGCHFIMVTWKRPNHDCDGPMRKNEILFGIHFIVSYNEIQDNG